MTMTIPLTRGRVTLVDDEDYEWLSQFKWHFHPGGGSGPARFGYASSKMGGNRKTYMHRLILGAGAGQEVDHIDRNSLNNQRANLRFATRSQQTANSERPMPTSGYRGVCVLPNAGPPTFRARIYIDGACRVGPARTTAADAARDYDDFAIRHFGPLAIVNFGGSA